MACKFCHYKLEKVYFMETFKYHMGENGLAKFNSQFLLFYLRYLGESGWLKTSDGGGGRGGLLKHQNTVI